MAFLLREIHDINLTCSKYQKWWAAAELAPDISQCLGQGHNDEEKIGQDLEQVMELNVNVQSSSSSGNMCVQPEAILFYLLFSVFCKAVCIRAVFLEYYVILEVVLGPSNISEFAKVYW